MTPKNSWKIRRRIIYTTLGFCAGCVVFLTLAGKDTQLNLTIANGVMFLAGSVIGSYIFGATWDDKNQNRKSPE